MVINMNESRLRTIAQLLEFLDATPQVQFSCHGDDGDNQRYGHISAVLARFDYPRCSKTERGVVRAYLVRASGYSRAQLARLVTAGVDTFDHAVLVLAQTQHRQVSSHTAQGDQEVGENAEANMRAKETAGLG
jgi:hypothetical protein